DGNRETTVKPEVWLPEKVNKRKEENIDASSTTGILSGEAEETLPEPEPMSGIDDSASATGQRPYNAEKSEKEPWATMTDEPPAKLTPARRSLLSAEHRTTEMPPSPPYHEDKVIQLEVIAMPRVFSKPYDDAN
ncbi:hypothetical protein MRX96_052122, partial [Rhipicephalus microplus]